MDKITVTQAVEKLFECVRPVPEHEELLLMEALGRVAFEDVFAHMAQPPFDRSAVDGYAANHLDLASAPAQLSVTQRIYAGDAPHTSLLRGTAARIMTGACIPQGATCVVRQEDTDLGGESVRVFCTAVEHQNYCFAGEELQKGEALIEKGERIEFAHIGLLAGQGLEKVKVYRRPQVGILCTGSELTEATCPLEPGKVYNSNGAMLYARAAELGARAREPCTAPDMPEELARRIGELLAASDIVVTTGGVSVGERDCMEQAGALLGAHALFHGIAAKPGTHAMAMLLGGKLIICLSGPPFAALVNFELLAAPVIRRLAGRSDDVTGSIRAVLAQPLCVNRSKVTRYVRVRIVGAEAFVPQGTHGSGALSTLPGCNGLIELAPDETFLEAGSTVDALLF